MAKRQFTCIGIPYYPIFKANSLRHIHTFTQRLAYASGTRLPEHFRSDLVDKWVEGHHLAKTVPQYPSCLTRFAKSLAHPPGRANSSQIVPIGPLPTASKPSPLAPAICCTRTRIITPRASIDDELPERLSD